jgi:hypothetical protein
VSCLVMKHTRSGLRRDVRADWRIILGLIAMCFVALLGNLLMNPAILGYFAIYFLSFQFLVVAVYARTFLLEIVVNVIYERAQTSRWAARLRDYLIDWLHSVQAQPIVFFAKHLGNKRDLNRAIRYIKINELTRYMVLVHVFSDVNRTAPDDLTQTLSMLVQMYPTIRIDVLLVEGVFGPGLVRQVEALLCVSPKRMTIASPSPQLSYSLAELGGLRIIMRANDRGEYALLKNVEIPLLASSTNFSTGGSSSGSPLSGGTVEIHVPADLGLGATSASAIVGEPASFALQPAGAGAQTGTGTADTDDRQNVRANAKTISKKRNSAHQSATAEPPDTEE